MILLLFILIVAVVILLDVSGSNLTSKILPLVYLVDDDTEKEHLGNESLSEMNPEDIAARAQDAMFGDSD